MEENKTLAIKDSWDLGDGWKVTVESINTEARYAVISVSRMINNKPSRIFEELIYEKGVLWVGDYGSLQDSNYYANYTNYYGNYNTGLFSWAKNYVKGNIYVDKIIPGTTSNSVQLRYTPAFVEKTLAIGESLDLGDGWKITVKSISPNSRTGIIEVFHEANNITIKNYNESIYAYQGSFSPVADMNSFNQKYQELLQGYPYSSYDQKYYYEFYNKLIPLYRDYFKGYILTGNITGDANSGNMQLLFYDYLFSLPPSIEYDRGYFQPFSPESMVTPTAVAVGTTVMIGAAASMSGGSILNGLSNYWRRIEEMVKELLKTGSKFAYDEIEEKILTGKDEDEKVKEIEDKGELKRLIIAGGIVFIAFAFDLRSNSADFEAVYKINPIIFLIVLAFFAVVAEVSHDMTIRFSLRLAGGRSAFQLSYLGIPITLISGIFGFVITAAGSTKILHKFTNPLSEALVVSSGTLFNLILGLYLLYIGAFYNIPWLAFAGALPNFATATFSMFPTYPFEGRRVFRGNKYLWGLVFLLSMTFYIYLIS